MHEDGTLAAAVGRLPARRVMVADGTIHIVGNKGTVAISLNRGSHVKYYNALVLMGKTCLNGWQRSWHRTEDQAHV